ncbi:MAG TPA: methylated-DNA--[protein]-cysteine S-methyltransferase [Melioribacteraceae bacterium]|nr:methylated-DNA--[protein]-cysteine S-methyltransferase [Melioribacteraceae bacterium]
MKKYKGYLNSKIGILEIICNEISLEEINFVEFEQPDEENNLIKDIKEQLNEYFESKRKSFNIPLLLKGTEFQKAVWNELQNIPYGNTISYKQVAANINNPKAVRAVGSANGKNKIPIIIPCHRVIGNNGKLSGYAGGAWRKEILLQIENTK